MSLNVCAVVVTFNRKDLLTKTLDSILSQNVPVGKIFVIDNASNDGTHDLLCEGKYSSKQMQSDMPHYSIFTSVQLDKVKIQYIKLKCNTGGAGGFCLGQKLSFDEGFDWIWMMDDDGYPSTDCLAKLLYASTRTGLLALNPLVIDKDDTTRLSFGLPGIDLVDKASERGSSDLLLHGVANPFNGTFIHRDVIDKIGLIKQEMFIWGDEVEYFLRMMNSKIDFATVVNAEFFHPKSKSELKLICGLFYVEVKPERLEMNFIRNKGFIDRVYKKKVSYKFLVKYSIMFISEMRFRRLIMALGYYIDGWRNSYKLPPIV